MKKTNLTSNKTIHEHHFEVLEYKFDKGGWIKEISLSCIFCDLAIVGFGNFAKLSIFGTQSRLLGKKDMENKLREISPQYEDD